MRFNYSRSVTVALTLSLLGRLAHALPPATDEPLSDETRMTVVENPDGSVAMVFAGKARDPLVLAKVLRDTTVTRKAKLKLSRELCELGAGARPAVPLLKECLDDPASAVPAAVALLVDPRAGILRSGRLAGTG